MTQPTREQVSATLWEIAEHTIVAEWICCEPINAHHDLCVQGDAARQMVKALLVDDPKSYRPAPLLDAVLAVLSAPVDRAAALTDAADRIDRTDLPDDFVDMFDNGAKWATGLLRRLAAGADTDTQDDGAMFGGPDCTCIPFSRQTDPPRYLNWPTDTVDMISGWERGRDCPHHAPVVSSSSVSAAPRHDEEAGA